MSQSSRRLLNYTLLREIGRGGMATVWYAENSVGRKFAIKILKPELVAEESSVAERFRNEAQIMVRLEHPAILRVEDFYEDGTTLAIIMEYLAGHDLNEHVRQRGAIAEAQVIDWFVRVLNAFDYVHQKGYFHRDVKPSNLFLTDSGIVKVMDFGIAKIVGADLSLTQTDMLMGSPLYMSPEQITSPKSVDFRTDIYSLGVTLYALLAGRKPYDDAETSMFHIQTAIVHEPLPKLTNVSEAVNNAIQRATQKKAADRFASCIEFARALDAKQDSTDDATLLKPLSTSKSRPLSDDATVLRPSHSKQSSLQPTDDATIVRPKTIKAAAFRPDTPLPSTPSPAPSDVIADIESSNANRSRKHIPLIVGSVIGLLVLGIGSWFIWSRQTTTHQSSIIPTNDPGVVKYEAASATSLSRTNKDLSRAISFYDKQRYDSALAIFNQYQNSPVMLDNAVALTDLGAIHFYGALDQGIPQNLVLAEKWLEKGVQKRNPKAYYFLGLFKDGVDFSTPSRSVVRGRNTEAVNLYQEAANLGDSYAQAAVGQLFLLRNQYLSNIDACRVLDYLKQAANKNIEGAIQNYKTLQASGRCN
ncbi:hypothetical protein DYU11_09110 [Fibrisoma montanum]|uniref:Protein kinase domain-containing protein n=1 Tax=Fibrisoma montanum TaxID=2305895 RepID=A0A418MF95_9BACT|nr:protein kinase [Fibrisoma montanum]RIV25446.1 hypothetical protein DYU11_09110 [Fibrisoma montanum]